MHIGGFVSVKYIISEKFAVEGHRPTATCNFYFPEQEAFEKCWAHSPLRAAARPDFTLPFTRCRYCRTPPLSHVACASMSTTTTTHDRGDHYGPIEWAQRWAGCLDPLRKHLGIILLGFRPGVLHVIHLQASKHRRLLLRVDILLTYRRSGAFVRRRRDCGSLRAHWNKND